MCLKNWVMKSNYKRLGDYIKQIKVRNSDLKAKELLGININKHFMPSVANIVGTDLTNYKLVQKNQFLSNYHTLGYLERLNSNSREIVQFKIKKQNEKQNIPNHTSPK